MSRRPEFIAVETANLGFVEIPIKQFETWFNQIDREKLMLFDFTEEEYKRVKKIVDKHQLGKKYSPVVYDFLIMCMNDTLTQLHS